MSGARFKNGTFPSAIASASHKERLGKGGKGTRLKKKRHLKGR